MRSSFTLHFLKNLFLLSSLMGIIGFYLIKNSREPQSQTRNLYPLILNLKIDGMTCEGCSYFLITNIEKMPGVALVEIDHQTGDGTIKGAPLVEPESIGQFINDSGYECLEMRVQKNR